VEETGKYSKQLKITLLDAIENLSLMLVSVVHVEMKKSRAKERIFSVRDDFGQWDEKTNVQSYLIY
jgi:sulfate adenylyltransferase subunit 2